MKKQVVCECGSGKIKDDCCAPNIRVFSQVFSDPSEHKEMLTKLQISSAFNLRYRGLVEFYGDDLIAYKLENTKSLSRNNFLHILGKYLSVYLEDSCPTSWKDCHPAFWEELILTYFPHLMKITPKEKEVEQFLSELKTFVHWLDCRVGCSWHPIILTYVNEYHSTLKDSEFVLNRLFLNSYPFIHDEKPNSPIDVSDFFHVTEDDVEEMKLSIFEVQNISGSIVVATELHKDYSYLIKGLPNETLSPGIIINGCISRRKQDWIWNWDFPEGVFPPKAKKYLKHITFWTHSTSNGC